MKRSVVFMNVFIMCWMVATVIIAIVQPWLCAAFGGAVPLLMLIKHRIEFSDVHKMLKER